MTKFTIFGKPITKKNHQNIFLNQKTGKPFITQSKQYKQYEKDAGYFLKPLEINEPVNVKAVYYIDQNRKVDMINLHSALHDILVKHRVLTDDNCKIIAGTDGSRVKLDRENPRTEVEIMTVEEYARQKLAHINRIMGTDYGDDYLAVLMQDCQREFDFSEGCRNG